MGLEKIVWAATRLDCWKDRLEESFVLLTEESWKAPAVGFCDEAYCFAQIGLGRRRPPPDIAPIANKIWFRTFFEKILLDANEKSWFLKQNNLNLKGSTPIR